MNNAPLIDSFGRVHPTDLPQNIDVDVSDLTEVGDAIHVRDLVVDREKCTLKVAEDEVVVHVVAPQVVREEEEAAVPVTGEEGEEAPTQKLQLLHLASRHAADDGETA